MKESVCDCNVCRAMCGVPCMGTPEEMKRIIDEYPDGYMLCVSDDNDPVYSFSVVKPKKSIDGNCVFFIDGCILHKAGLKPIEGRVAVHGKDNPRKLYKMLSRAWNTKRGRALVKSFSPIDI